MKKWIPFSTRETTERDNNASASTGLSKATDKPAFLSGRGPDDEAQQVEGLAPSLKCYGRSLAGFKTYGRVLTERVNDPLANRTSKQAVCVHQGGAGIEHRPAFTSE
jgi:hypothetical protein